MKRLEEIFLRFAVYFFVVVCAMSIIFWSHTLSTGVMVVVVYDKLILAFAAAAAMLTVAHFLYYGFENELHKH